MVRNIVETISVVPDPIFRISYIKETSRLLDLPEETLMTELNKLLRAKFKKSLGVEGEVIPDEPVIAQPQDHPEEETLPAGYYQERELVKLLLLYGTESIDDTTVAQFIIDDLLNDEITFTDPVNRVVFDAYDQALNTGELPNDQYFITHPDEKVSQLAIDLLTTPYKLDQWEKYGIFVKREEDMLKACVESSILRYKDQIIDARRKTIEKQLKEEQDPDNQLLLLKEKKRWDDLRVQINKLLGIVIAK